MSYDLVVWEGEPPSSDDDALTQFKALYERYGKHHEAPTPAIRAFMSNLTARCSIWSGMWAVIPQLGAASGPFVYLCITPSRAEEVGASIIELSQAHELVCFDPQGGSVY